MHEQPSLRLVTDTTPATRPAATDRATLRNAPEWRECPNCHQSATGLYFGIIGCFRCGWPRPAKRIAF